MKGKLQTIYSEYNYDTAADPRLEQVS